ncbi:HNH endonuclease signature motif containing protein [Phaeodactylibacter xiamenensis]|uniref:HNH endonuclease signature motif containing protein n=1 Tax=Phaeodactylibacter xiamenensis TaxID=1524460 RepID=UPI003BAC882F
MNLFLRKPGTNRFGSKFSDREVEAVWQKGQVIPGENPSFYRKDACGAIMYRYHYGKQVNNGWEIDHIKPSSKGGTDDLSNLQPMQWENNRQKGDNYPNYECALTA